MSLKVKKFQFNMFGVNTYVVSAPDGEAMIVDPGMISQAEADQINRYITEHSLTVKEIVCTHLHIDHAFGVKAAAEAFGVKPRAHAADLTHGLNLADQARLFGLPEDIVEQQNEYLELADNAEMELGGENIIVIHTPGHSPGGVALYAPESNWVITGDSLFSGSIGRTDLPGGNYATLMRSLQLLAALPPQTVVYPGHGSATTIDDEKHSNPYL